MTQIIYSDLMHILGELTNTGSLVQVEVVSDLFILERCAINSLNLWAYHILHAELPHKLEHVIG